MNGGFPQKRREIVWSPPIDVEETNDSVIIRVELPGVKRKDIKISVFGDTLTISGERRRETETNGANLHCVERTYGRFARSVRLPVGVESDKGLAFCQDGVLELTLPKSQETVSREIKVEGADDIEDVERIVGSLKLDDVERRAIEEALKKTTNLTELSRIVGIHRDTLRRKMIGYGLLERSKD